MNNKTLREKFESFLTIVEGTLQIAKELCNGEECSELSYIDNYVSEYCIKYEKLINILSKSKVIRTSEEESFLESSEKRLNNILDKNIIQQCMSKLESDVDYLMEQLEKDRYDIIQSNGLVSYNFILGLFNKIKNKLDHNIYDIYDQSLYYTFIIYSAYIMDND